MQILQKKRKVRWWLCLLLCLCMSYAFIDCLWWARYHAELRIYQGHCHSDPVLRKLTDAEGKICSALAPKETSSRGCKFIVKNFPRMKLFRNGTARISHAINSSVQQKLGVLTRSSHQAVNEKKLITWSLSWVISCHWLPVYTIK